MLIHQIPPKPNYLRVKVGRRLARIGATALKNTVYVLPWTDGAMEDFQWVLREVMAAGGDAAIIHAQLVDGLSDGEVEALFREARDEDYAALAEEVRSLDRRLGATPDEELRRQVEAELSRLERQVEEVANIDFFDASGRLAVQGLLRALRSRVTPVPLLAASIGANASNDFQEWTWVTRAGIQVDRIASAWLIRRFIDPMASFKFVPPSAYQPEPGELRFDMFDAEFSHEGDKCTFEVLCARFELEAPGLHAIAEIVHDIDLKDEKFRRPETSGLAAQIAGITLLHQSDETRMQRGADLLDAMLGYFAKKRD